LNRRTLNNMRILHIWDQAGVAHILAKYQSRQGYSSSVLRVKDQDKYGINKFYDHYVIYCSQEDFIQRSLKEAAAAQLIHVHSRIDVLLPLRQRFGKSKRIILHYHGTDIRGLDSYILRRNIGKFLQVIPLSKLLFKRLLRRRSTHYLRHRKAQAIADAVLVSTPDLLDLVDGATYIPNPVDTEHFSEENPKKDGKKAVTIKSEVTDIQWALNYCKKKGINFDIEVYDRTQRPIMYKDMPEFLKRYDIYVDIRYVNGHVLQNLSKSALESLASGLEVIDYRLKYLRGLPPEHSPSSVISRISSIYGR
jgi:hypothetical protein